MNALSKPAGVEVEISTYHQFELFNLRHLPDCTVSKKLPVGDYRVQIVTLEGEHYLAVLDAASGDFFGRPMSFWERIFQDEKLDVCINDDVIEDFETLTSLLPRDT